MGELIGKCPRCGALYYGWALESSLKHRCDICHAELKILRRQHLESVMLRRLETAATIYARQAEELANVFMKHIDKFEMTVRVSFKNASGR